MDFFLIRIWSFGMTQFFFDITSAQTSRAAQNIRHLRSFAGRPCRTGKKPHRLFLRTPLRGPHTAISPDHRARTQEPGDPSHLPPPVDTMRADACASLIRHPHDNPWWHLSSYSRWMRQVIPLQHVQLPIYFCSIQMKHLKHMSETAETLVTYV
jgi:hypothetical protein